MSSKKWGKLQKLLTSDQPAPLPSEDEQVVLWFKGGIRDAAYNQFTDWVTAAGYEYPGLDSDDPDEVATAEILDDCVRLRRWVMFQGAKMRMMHLVSGLSEVGAEAFMRDLRNKL